MITAIISHSSWITWKFQLMKSSPNYQHFIILPTEHWSSCRKYITHSSDKAPFESLSLQKTSLKHHGRGDPSGPELDILEQSRPNSSCSNRFWLSGPSPAPQLSQLKQKRQEVPIMFPIGYTDEHTLHWDSCLEAGGWRALDTREAGRRNLHFPYARALLSRPLSTNDQH